MAQSQQPPTSQATPHAFPQCHNVNTDDMKKRSGFELRIFFWHINPDLSESWNDPRPSRQGKAPL